MLECICGARLAHAAIASSRVTQFDFIRRPPLPLAAGERRATSRGRIGAWRVIEPFDWLEWPAARAHANHVDCCGRLDCCATPELWLQSASQSRSELELKFKLELELELEASFECCFEFELAKTRTRPLTSLRHKVATTRRST